MSELPTLTAGRAGRVDHAMVNRVFRATERVEGMADGLLPEGEGSRLPAVARLTSKVTSEWLQWDTWEWRQVAANKIGGWDFVDYGMRSDMWTPQRLVVTPRSMKTGDMVHLHPMPSLRGDTGEGVKGWLLGLPLVAPPAQVVTGQILFATNAGDPLTMGYQGYIIGRHQNVAMDLFGAIGVPVMPAVNSFELSTQLQTQVAQNSPGTKTLLRLPVGTLVGPVVKMPSVTGELWMFTQPNAYTITC